MISIPCRRYKTINTVYGRRTVSIRKLFYRNFNTAEEAAKWIIESDFRFTRQRKKVQAVIIPKEIENKILALYFHMIK